MAENFYLSVLSVVCGFVFLSFCYELSRKRFTFEGIFCERVMGRNAKKWGEMQSFTIFLCRKIREKYNGKPRRRAGRPSLLFSRPAFFPAAPAPRRKALHVGFRPVVGENRARRHPPHAVFRSPVRRRRVRTSHAPNHIMSRHITPTPSSISSTQQTTDKTSETILGLVFFSVPKNAATTRISDDAPMPVKKIIRAIFPQSI
jgi:hypothetical protein